MPRPQVKAVEFATPLDDIDPAADNTDIVVRLEDGTFSSFVAATPDQPARWMRETEEAFAYGTPVLYVRRLDPEGVRKAVDAMAADMGGYWLRYYNSLGDPAKKGGQAASKRGPRRSEP